ncbi:hypothetical protein FRX31_020101 [Thalictrum thalictroides]|uniref:S-protein homolog n=1 Tax=Thalictrum thalictroides TaxID=46969 RepID=A0A7J6W0M6_THATH|nr:hypothetical protein FRX31_020101 [Thalictrum thalictroides]
MAIGKFPPLLLVMVVVLLSSECSSVLAIKWSVFKTTVTIINSINSPLHVHCKSGNDDIGPKVLGHGEQMSWRFVMNFWETTLYWCSMSWVDSNGHQLYGSGDVFKKHQVKRCQGPHLCRREARKDGLWASGDPGNGDQGAYMLFPWSSK